MIDRGKTRFVAEAHLVERAVAGDAQAANRVLQYLSSENLDLRGLMVETLHDVSSPQLWAGLLHCLALHRWSAEGVDCSRRADPQASARIDRAVAEAYTQDESRAENAAKGTVLMNALGEADPRLRHAAAWLLGLRGSLTALPGLEEIIYEAEAHPENPKTWPLRAAEALACVKDERSGHLLVRLLALDHAELHNAANLALTRLGRWAGPGLIEALHHIDPHVRWHAAAGLGPSGDSHSLQVLAEGLGDENNAVRQASARLLSECGPQAIPAILTFLSRGPLSEPLRQAAYHALHAMPAHPARERLEPLLAALRGPTPSADAPYIAQKLLLEWESARPA